MGDRGTHGLAEHLAGLPHFHVIAQNRNNEIVYSDGLTWPGAEGFSADLIAPAPGAPVPEVELEAVWIVEADPRWCPLAHGDDTAAPDEEAAADYLQRSTQQPPYWSALP
ncbi:hypothetical protein [Mycobacterium sherrisii]|uniref:Uncharacterized protein n=1 Tax=Mycobacterium sherrisii TaxID=243061 RepID=A0A1E3T718_9MYCO|nr:hypothetical protein [Mycobacterium sherrisii]MCV7029705.1 hypothetical protein [Mycobacterium sherrisii]MEC4762326.1 hypothetical protein [Mycobacterium sherrisii]ODR09693.1 hypothetical protein BHQ21_03615 [Mycobacterium sherrisii]ORW74988.1 hypothetical protein AWC25_15005 [Mycobacterium sherrisii]